MNVSIDDHFHVANEPDLWKLPEWAKNTGATIRVVQTVVGPYGAIDQPGGTTWFDVGDHLIQMVGRIVAVPPYKMAEIISLNQEQDNK